MGSVPVTQQKAANTINARKFIFLLQTNQFLRTAMRQQVRFKSKRQEIQLNSLPFLVHHKRSWFSEVIMGITSVF